MNGVANRLNNTNIFTTLPVEYARAECEPSHRFNPVNFYPHPVFHVEIRLNCDSQQIASYSLRVNNSMYIV